MTAGKNILVYKASTGVATAVGTWAGAKLGASLGSAAGPVGFTIGAAAPRHACGGCRGDGSGAALSFSDRADLYCRDGLCGKRGVYKGLL